MSASAKRPQDDSPAGETPGRRSRLHKPEAGITLVGCAGWSLPKDQKKYFPQEGTHLQRYAALFPAVEINSSFYRPHRVSTYRKWAASVPADFRFSVKFPKAITHAARLENVDEALSAFLAEVEGLGTKLGCLLIQTPPSFAFTSKPVEKFLELLRRKTSAAVVFEPRHSSWFDPAVDSLFNSMSIARACADPPPVPAATSPAGWRGVTYYRLHGSPRVYYSSYSQACIQRLARRMAVDEMPGRITWCIFDNTALGAAIPNALQLLRADRS